MPRTTPMPRSAAGARSSQADRVLKQFRGRFLGKSSPSHFWWGAFDLSCTRFSGAPRRRIRAASPTSPTASRARRTRTSASAPAGGLARRDSPVTEPAFYAYAYPEPDGCPDARIAPSAAATI